MQAKIALLADAANMTPEGKLNILGEFNIMWTSTFPATWPLMWLVLKLEATAAEGGSHMLTIKCIDDDGTQVGPTIDGELNMGKPFRPGMPHRGAVILGIRNAQFPKAGTYEFEILVDGHSIASVPLYVLPSAERPQGKG